MVVADVFSDGPWLKFWLFFASILIKILIYIVSGQLQRWNIFYSFCCLFHIPSCFKFVVGWLQMWPRFFIPFYIHICCNMTAGTSINRLNLSLIRRIWFRLLLCFGQWNPEEAMASQSWAWASEVVSTSTLAWASLLKDERLCWSRQVSPMEI